MLVGFIDFLLCIADVSRCTKGVNSMLEDQATVVTLTIFVWNLFFVVGRVFEDCAQFANAPQSLGTARYRCHQNQARGLASL